jgi:hypothetical protein
MAKKKSIGPMVNKNPVTTNHRSLDVHPSQVAEANEYARKLTGFELFRGDGKMEASRSQVKKYVEALNRNRPEGQARLVNFDGGYGDPT